MYDEHVKAFLAAETKRLQKASRLAFGTRKPAGRPEGTSSTVEWIMGALGLKSKRALERRIQEIERRHERRALERDIKRQRVMNYLAERRLRLL